MDHTRFDQLVRSFSRSRSRRGFLAAAGGFLALASQPARANQLLPATCAQTGQVCTMLYGCCSGLTCATSSINPSYGVCVPGEGGMVTTGTSLVVPFDGSDTAQAQSVSDAVTDTSTTTTTTSTIDDREAEQDAREAERDARKAQVEARRDTRKANLETRRDTQQQRREDEREAADIADGPNLLFRLSFPNSIGQAEVLKVTNQDDVTVYITRIESRKYPADGVSPTTVPTLGVGESFLLKSGVTIPREAESGELTWTQAPVCTGLPDDGFIVTAGFSTASAKTEYEVFCSETTKSFGTTAATTSASRKRRRKKRNSPGRPQSRGKQKSRGKGK
jgi:hypothetical protein